MRQKRKAVRRSVKKKFYKYRKDTRNYQSPIYKRWKQAVLKRDGHSCQFPGCGCSKRLEIHHIRPWSKYPSMRYEVSNGITLCHRCHESIRGKEEMYIPLFMKVLELSLLYKIKVMKKNNEARNNN